MYSHLLQYVLLPPVLRLRGRPYFALAKRLRAHQYRPRERVEAEQLAMLRDLLSHARRHVPYYQERFREVGDLRCLGDTERLPLLTKEDILRNFPDRMTARELRAPDWRYVGTRGTTDRVIVLHDRARRELEWSTLMVAMTEDSDYALGKPLVLIPPDECSKLCGTGESHPRGLLRRIAATAKGSLRDPGARAELRGLVMERWIRRASMLPPFGADGTHLDGSALSRYVELLWKHRPFALKALPEYLYGLARHARRSGNALPSIPLVKPMGSNLCSGLRPFIESAFRGQIREDYGSQEMGAMAFDCRYRNGLHVLEDCFLIEVVRRGKQAPAGEVGSLVVTDLYNRAMPLIRYRIGDVGRLETEPCPCGRSSPRLFVEGRLEDTLVTSDGRLLTPEALGKFFYGFPGIDEFQLVESVGRFLHLRYVPSGDGPDEPELKARFRVAFRDDRPFRMTQVRTIPPEPSGKFRHSKSRSYPEIDCLLPTP